MVRGRFAKELPYLSERRGRIGYMRAFEDLLAYPKALGGIVVRDGFVPPESVPKDRIPFDDLFSEDLREATTNTISSWWDKNGYPGTLISPPYDTGRLSRRGFAGTGDIVRGNAAITQLVALKGTQRLYVTPGMDHRAEKTNQVSVVAMRDALSQAAKFTEAVRGASSSDARLAETFNMMSPLRPGDVALIMGHPIPALVALRTPVGSLNATFAHTFEGRSSNY